jgi:hypothetical protein
LKGQKAFDYQNKSIINLIGWQVYDMGSIVEFLGIRKDITYGNMAQKDFLMWSLIEKRVVFSEKPE